MRGIDRAPGKCFQGSGIEDEDALNELLHGAEGLGELRDVVGFLIEHRERMRDTEIERLARETAAVLERLGELRQEALLEELRSFKDILLLQRKLVEENGRERD